MDKLIDYNKKYIEAESERMTFIAEPCELEVQSTPEMEAEVGGEKVCLAKGPQKFMVSGKQLKKIGKDGVFRLKNACNVRLDAFDDRKARGECLGTEMGTGKHVINWLLKEKSCPVEVKMDNASLLKGVAEWKLARKKPGERAYFDKFGFVRIDEQTKGLTKVWFTHE